MKRFVITSVAILSLLCFVVEASATSHILMKNKEGVWIASDSLMRHGLPSGDSSLINVCKVSFAHNRVIVGAGHFTSYPLFLSQADQLPHTSLDREMRMLGRLLVKYGLKIESEATAKQLLPGQYEADQGAIILEANPNGEHGIFDADQITLQRTKFDFQAKWMQLNDGIPHGMGELVEREWAKAATDPKLARNNSENPKKSLLHIIEEEAKRNASEVGGPFSVILMKPNGDLVDYSDDPICHSSLLSIAPKR